MVSLSVPVIVGAALVDSINPCVIGVLVFMLAFLIRTVKKKIKLITDGFGYTAGVYLTYFILGVLIFRGLDVVRQFAHTGIATLMYKVIGIVIIILGVVELKDFFWYGKGFSLQIPAVFEKKIEIWGRHWAKRTARDGITGVTTAFGVGFLVTLVELPCTGAPYLAIIALLSQAGMSVAAATPLLLLYNLVFIAPLVGIIVLVYKGLSVRRFEGWRKKHRGFMRLFAGLLLVSLGVLMFFWTTLSARLSVF